MLTYHNSHACNLGSSISPGNNISIVTSRNNEGDLCILCSFDDDSASACVAVYFEIRPSNPNGLINLSVTKIDRVGKEGHECIKFHNPGNGDHHNIAVFAFSNMKKMISGQPLRVLRMNVFSTTEKGDIATRYNAVLLPSHYITVQLLLILVCIYSLPCKANSRFSKPDRYCICVSYSCRHHSLFSECT